MQAPVKLPNRRICAAPWEMLASRTFIAIALASASMSQPARACEPADYHPTPVQAQQDALAYFREAAFVYEGILLGSHNFDKGGRFLVLKAYKGPAKALDVVPMPGGSSCYGDVAPFAAGVWAYRSNIMSFDGFETKRTVDLWKQQRLLHTWWLTPVQVFYSLLVALLTLIVAAAVSLFRRRTK